jgi:hypothetical protein
MVFGRLRNCGMAAHMPSRALRILMLNSRRDQKRSWIHISAVIRRFPPS